VCVHLLTPWLPSLCRGDLEKVKDLVNVGANPNSFDWDRRSALHLSAAEGHIDTVEFLIECKADVNCKDRWGGDPLKDAIRGKHLKVQQALKAAGAVGEADEHSDHGQTMGERLVFCCIIFGCTHAINAWGRGPGIWLLDTFRSLMYTTIYIRGALVHEDLYINIHMCMHMYIICMCVCKCA
jgi:hypothetical protein